MSVAGGDGLAMAYLHSRGVAVMGIAVVCDGRGGFGRRLGIARNVDVVTRGLHSEMFRGASFAVTFRGG